MLCAAAAHAAGVLPPRTFLEENERSSVKTKTSAPGLSRLLPARLAATRSSGGTPQLTASGESYRASPALPCVWSLPYQNTLVLQKCCVLRDSNDRMQAGLTF